MPSTTSSTVSMDFASSTVITPSLPTFSIASARILPIVSSLFSYRSGPRCFRRVLPLSSAASRIQQSPYVHHSRHSALHHVRQRRFSPEHRILVRQLNP